MRQSQEHMVIPKAAAPKPCCSRENSKLPYALQDIFLETPTACLCDRTIGML